MQTTLTGFIGAGVMFIGIILNAIFGWKIPLEAFGIVGGIIIAIVSLLTDPQSVIMKISAGVGFILTNILNGIYYLINMIFHYQVSTELGGIIMVVMIGIMSWIVKDVNKILPQSIPDSNGLASKRPLGG